MSVRVQIPPALRSATGGRRALEAEGETLADVLANLGRDNPALALHLFDENGVVRRNIVCIHDERVVRPADFSMHAVGNACEVIIANALAGG